MKPRRPRAIAFLAAAATAMAGWGAFALADQDPRDVNLVRSGSETQPPQAAPSDGPVDPFGRVRYIDYQASGAGNYAVIKGRKYDYVYMHMLHKPSVKRGERVESGEKIGKVGSTGRSTACHLHFEMWRKPGWYRGGSLVNPKPFLKRWDRG